MVIMAQAMFALIALAVGRSLVLRRDFFSPITPQPKVGWKIFVGAIMMPVLQVTLIIRKPGKTIFQTLIMLFTHVALVPALLVNRHIPGIKVAATGAVLNIAALVANGGWMPITPEAAHFVYRDKVPIEVGARPSRSKSVVLPRKKTRLWLLSDIIRIKSPRRRSAVSIGDLLLVAGMALFLFRTTAQKEKIQ